LRKQIKLECIRNIVKNENIRKVLVNTEVKMKKINQKNFQLDKIKEKHNNATANVLKIKTQRKVKTLKIKDDHLDAKQNETIKSKENINKHDRAVNNHERYINERIKKLKLHNNIVEQRLVKNKENIKPESDKQCENNWYMPTKSTKDEEKVDSSNVLSNKINIIKDN